MQSTITGIKGIIAAALFFAFVVDFSLDSAGFDLVFVAAAVVIFFSGRLRSP